MFCLAFCKKMLGFSFKQKESNEQTKVLQKAEKKQNKKIGNPNNGGQKKQMNQSTLEELIKQAEGLIGIINSFNNIKKEFLIC